MQQFNDEISAIRKLQRYCEGNEGELDPMQPDW